jgi:hypothetical protein
MLVTSCLLVAASAAAAQPQQPVPPDPATVPASPGRSPAMTYLMQAHHISEAEARERIDVQTEVIALTNKIQQEKDAAFSSVVIQHEPVFKVIVIFADTKDRKAWLGEISPRLRRYVQLRVAKRSREGKRSEMARLSAALRPAGVPFHLGYDNLAERFIIHVEDSAAADKLKTLVPAALASDVQTDIAPLPKPEAGPTGVQAGDWSEAGYEDYTDISPLGRMCTLAFPITFGASNTKGILTAGHCTEPKNLYINSHWVTFPAPPYFERNADAYDYAIYETGSLNSDYQVFYRDKNGIPEFADTGWLHTKNYITGFNQVNGMTVCKSGGTTGITCGKIVDDSYEYRPGWWFIEVSQTQQADISEEGDSGGPWFLYPGSSIDITAAGIHNAGSGTGYSSIAVYMPIDRVFDHVANVHLILKP